MIRLGTELDGLNAYLGGVRNYVVGGAVSARRQALATYLGGHRTMFICLSRFIIECTLLTVHFFCCFRDNNFAFVDVVLRWAESRTVKTTVLLISTILIHQCRKHTETNGIFGEKGQSETDRGSRSKILPPE
jgi:hypothetical protein